MPFTLKSAAFAEGRSIPREHTGEGEDLSPPLHWEGLPRGTRELALICTDADAWSEGAPWVHWVLYRIPTEVSKVPRGLHKEELPAYPLDLTHGRNSWGGVGYGGPLPPGDEEHRYSFKIFALDCELTVPPALDAHQLEEVMKGHVLATAELHGRYGHPTEHVNIG